MQQVMSLCTLTDFFWELTSQFLWNVIHSSFTPPSCECLWVAIGAPVMHTCFSACKDVCANFRGFLLLQNVSKQHSTLLESSSIFFRVSFQKTCAASGGLWDFYRREQLPKLVPHPFCNREMLLCAASILCTGAPQPQSKSLWGSFFNIFTNLEDEADAKWQPGIKWAIKWLLGTKPARKW